MGAPEADGKINAALAACRVAIAAIRNLRTSQDRIDTASQLSERLREYSEEAGHIRNVDAIRIWQAEDLSLSQLGERIHNSKQLAAQIVDRYKKGKLVIPSVEEASEPETSEPVADLEQRAEDRPMREQVTELQKEVAELRRRTGRIEASLAVRPGQSRGGKREQANTAASDG